MQLVSDPQQLEQACRALRAHPVFYLDTEFDSGREGTELCLIQVSGDDGEVYLVDALSLRAELRQGVRNSFFDRRSFCFNRIHLFFLPQSYTKPLL